MSDSLNHVLEAAVALPEVDRVQLVDALIATLEPENAAPFDDTWRAEIERRSREFDTGFVQPVSWDEVRETAHRRVASDG